MEKKWMILMLGGILAGWLLPVTRGSASDEPASSEPDMLSSPLMERRHVALRPFLLLDVREEASSGRSTYGPGEPQGNSSSGSEGGLGSEDAEEALADPLEPLNRVIFQFNEKLYFWLLKPVATGYKAVVPEPARVGIRNFFHNLAFPVRFVNSVLQGKMKGAGDELARFVANSTFGLGGFLDVLPEEAHASRSEEDLGQTFGAYGMGPGIYLQWPVFGPSSLRDSVGSVGDAFLDPVNYIFPHTKYNVAARGFGTVNDTSLRIGDYESLIKASLDPYIALRNAYIQNRRAKILE